MFTTELKVRLYDTDMAGLLFFANQFRFAHATFEEFIEFLGIPFKELLFNKDYYMAIVHAEADYFASLKVGDQLYVELSLEKIGASSITTFFSFYKKPENQLIGTAKTVHVVLDHHTKRSTPIPEELKKKLSEHLREVSP